LYGPFRPEQNTRLQLTILKKLFIHFYEWKIVVAVNIL
jgi:hypothetical protein